MASKLEGNGLWESGRMMLPEHKEAINVLNGKLKRRERVYLDEQELEEINRGIQESMKYKVAVTIRMYDPLEELRIVGVVENISMQRGQFRVGDDWFMMEDIEGIEQC